MLIDEIEKAPGGAAAAEGIEWARRKLAESDPVGRGLRLLANDAL
jgi:hypothetical protein